MSLNYVKDPAAQVPTFTAAGKGVDAIVQYYQNGTDEVRNLLKNECSMIYECSYCRSLFRSFINFIAHKRTICRSLHSTIRAEQLESEQQKAPQGANEQEKDEGTSKRNVKNTRSLRRFNPTSSLSKHISCVNVRLEQAKANIEIQTLPKVVRPTANTTIVNGKQVIEEFPIGFAIKDRIPENRVALVMPSENSARYGEMQLRRRRSAYLASKAGEGIGSREMTPEEIAIVERIPSAMPVDFINLRCEDERCVKNNQQPFHQLSPLAHHLAIYHQVNYSESALLKKSPPYIKCFLCDISPFKTLKDLQNHFNKTHSHVRAQHIKIRIDSNTDSSKRKEIPKYRGRSLSPISMLHDMDGQDEVKSIEVMDLNKNVRKGTKPIQLPEIKLTQHEEHEQQLAAAFALNEWIKEKKNIEGRTGSGDEISNRDIIEDELTVEFDQFVNKNDSPCIERIIDEEEARKIDQLLNCKTPQKGAKIRSSSVCDVTGEEPTHSLAINRSPRPRKPNKKYENYDKMTNDLTKKRTLKSRKSETPVKEPLKDERTIKKTPDGKEVHPQKRKLSSAGTAQHEMNHKKMTFGSLTRKTNPKEEGAPNLVTEPEIQDFVLPESIKSTEHLEEFLEETGEKKEEMNSHIMPDQKMNTTDPSTYAGEVEKISSDQATTSTTFHSEQEGASPTFTTDNLPSMLTDRYKEELILYSPRAQILKNAIKEKRTFFSDSSRRKQNLNELPLEEGDGLSVLGTKNAPERQMKIRPPPKPKDLALIPVYLTEVQRDLYFKPLKNLFNQNTQSDGLCQCGECGEVLKNIKDGRRHMVSHVRVIRMRCSLCDVGAFFCSDMRVHLMYRHCDKLNLAPEDFVSPGVPCMNKEKADMLTQLVDPYCPGRIMYSTGKIVSWTSPKAYYPDPKIERNILGPVLPGYLGSPNASPRKIRSAILSPRKIQLQQVQKEEKPDEAETSEKHFSPTKSTETPQVVGHPSASSADTISPEKISEQTQTHSITRKAADDHDYPIEACGTEKEIKKDL